jgi:hypothetical protein
MIRAFVDWLMGRERESFVTQAGALVPQDPSGRAASGQSQHLVVVPAGDFWIRTDRTPPALLTWHSTDTSVARLEVSADTFSALVRVLAPGVTHVTVSDGLTVERKVVTVKQRTLIGARPIGLSIEPILNVAGVGDGQGKDETPAPALP